MKIPYNPEIKNKTAEELGAMARRLYQVIPQPAETMAAMQAMQELERRAALLPKVQEALRDAENVAYDQLAGEPVVDIPLVSPVANALRARANSLRTRSASAPQEKKNPMLYAAGQLETAAHRMDDAHSTLGKLGLRDAM